jgi:hypothetical protein
MFRLILNKLTGPVGGPKPNPHNPRCILYLIRQKHLFELSWYLLKLFGHLLEQILPGTPTYLLILGACICNPIHIPLTEKKNKKIKENEKKLGIFIFYFFVGVGGKKLGKYRCGPIYYPSYIVVSIGIPTSNLVTS